VEGAGDAQALRPPAGSAAPAAPSETNREHANDFPAAAARAPASASATAPPSGAARVPADVPETVPTLTPPASGEALRSTVAALDRNPILRGQLGTLRDHFGGSGGPFALQRIELAGGRTAVLVARADESDPIVLVVDRDQLVWSKPRPAAGITTPALHPTIAPRPDGGVALFVYVATLRMLAARMWADDGNAFAEIELGTFDVCDGLSAAYAPVRGWVLACASGNGTRGQRLRENGTTAWGPDGAALGAAIPSGPPTIAFDTGSSFVLLERARAVGGNRLLALRFDDDAHPLWPDAIQIGAARPPDASAPARVRAAVPREGTVEIKGAGARRTEIDSAGRVVELAH
jgi:hypothetical protein